MTETASLDSAALIALEDRYHVPVYAKLPMVLVRGSGSWVWDADGRKYLDLYGGHCVASLGHCHPRVVAAIQRQAETLLFYSNVVYNDARAAACERLVALVPPELRRVFLCNSGTEANETALKIARKHTGRQRVIALREGFHGRTLGSLGVTGLPGLVDPSYPVAAACDFVPFGDLHAVADLIGSETAAVMLEPIPSMGGIRCAPDAYYQGLRDLCDEHGALLVFDEVQTGFGRTGTPFFGDGVGVQPDVITGAKGAAGGMPAGVVFVRDTLSAAMNAGDQGTTFGGGPLACAALAVVAEVLLSDELPRHALEREAQLRDALCDMSGLRGVSGKGLLLGLDLDQPAKPIIAKLRDAGFLVGGGKDPQQIRLMPPLTITHDELQLFSNALGMLLA
ncbi:MAG: acetylornithine aminotransferase [Planctomycetota bacterium]|nr:MAG: acetylornithine aminotransferase [Planctomycetota bacterium]